MLSQSQHACRWFGASLAIGIASAAMLSVQPATVHAASVDTDPACAAHAHANCLASQAPLRAQAGPTSLETRANAAPVELRDMLSLCAIALLWLTNRWLGHDRRRRAWQKRRRSRSTFTKSNG
jgi:hypothetical protein